MMSYPIMLVVGSRFDDHSEVYLYKQDENYSLIKKIDADMEIFDVGCSFDHTLLALTFKAKVELLDVESERVIWSNNFGVQKFSPLFSPADHTLLLCGDFVGRESHVMEGYSGVTLPVTRLLSRLRMLCFNSTGQSVLCCNWLTLAEEVSRQPVVVTVNDITSGQPLATFARHAFRVNSGCIRESTAVTADESGEVFMWNVATCEVTGSFTFSGGEIKTFLRCSITSQWDIICLRNGLDGTSCCVFGQDGVAKSEISFPFKVSSAKIDMRTSSLGVATLCPATQTAAKHSRIIIKDCNTGNTIKSLCLHFNVATIQFSPWSDNVILL